MPDLFPATIDEQIACVEREIRKRRTAYPRWVATGRMSRDKADREIATMEAVATTLCRLRTAPPVSSAA